MSLILLLVVSAKLLQKQIVDRAISEVNKTIAVPVLVDQVSFSLLKRFPHATVQFSDVKVLSGKNFNAKHFKNSSADTLAQIENVFVSINLLAFFNNTIEVKKIEINKAQVNILIDKTGLNNYQVFNIKKDDVPADSNHFNIEMNEVIFVKSNVLFKNLYKDSRFSISAPSFIVKGAWHNSTYSIATKGDLLLRSFKMGKSVYQPKHPSNIQLNMRFANDSLILNSSKIIAADAQFKLSGYSVLKDKNYTNIKITGQKISISHLLLLLPFKEELSGISSDGYLDFNGLIKGRISNKRSPYLLANFGISEGSISYKDSINLRDINLKGRFSNGDKRSAETMSLSFKEFSFITDSSSFNGSFDLNNFQHPKYVINSSFNLNLKDFVPFFSEKYLSGVSGSVQGKIKTAGQVNDSIAFDSIQFLIDNTKAKLMFSSVAFNLPMQKLSFNKVNSTITYQRNHISCDTITGYFNGMYTIGNQVSVENMNAIFKNVRLAPLKVQGNFKLDSVQYSRIQPLFVSDEETSDPMPFLITGNLSVGHYQHKKILASNLSSKVYLANNDFRINELTFDAFDGKITTSLGYAQKKGGKAVVKVKAKTTGVEISAFFKAFDNFGQKNLSYENIKGNLTSDFECEYSMVNGKFDVNSLDLLGYTKIENGQLINYEPIEELARFTNLDELNNLSFSTIETDLLVSNSNIHFPQMDIESNAFDISLFGKQELQGNYEYHIRIYLSDIVSGKTKKLQKQQSEFGEVEDDGLGRTSIFLVSTSVDGKVKTRFDRKQLREHLKGEFANEKQELKQLFNEEYNWFSSDTNSVKTDNKEESDFEIEWDDE